MFALLLLCLYTVSAIPAYRRFLFQAKDTFNPSNNPAAVLDPFHKRMITFEDGTVYDEEDAIILREEAFTFYRERYGLDFSRGVYNPVTDSYALPTATLFPFANGDDYLYRLVLDTSNDEVWEENQYFVFDVGYLAFVTASGNFTGGAMNGTSFQPGNLLGYTQYTYLREDQRDLPHNCKDIEIIKVLGNWPAFQRVNSQGFNEQYIKAEAVDEHDRRGFIAIDTTVTLFPHPQNGTLVPFQRIRTTITFNHTKPHTKILY